MSEEPPPYPPPASYPPPPPYPPPASYPPPPPYPPPASYPPPPPYPPPASYPPPPYYPPHPGAGSIQTSPFQLQPQPGGAPGNANGGDVRRRAGLAVAAAVALLVLGAVIILGVWYLRGGHHGNAANSVAPTTSTPGPVSFPPTTTVSNTSTTPTTTPPARSPGQLVASSIDGDITQSIAARKLIGPANAHTRVCLATTADVDALDSAANTRTDLVARLARLDVHAVAGGAAVVADLTEAWTYSAQADRAYADWARHHLTCTGHAASNGDADWERAHSNDLMSTAAKRRAVTDWNPIAARYHLPARSADTI